MFSVNAIPGQNNPQHVFGRLCHKGPLNGKTVQVLSHGATFDHRYWDFPYKPNQYSYVQKATQAGYATLDLDRLGYGYSSQEQPLAYNYPVQGRSIHQIVQSLRTGGVGPQFKKVMLAGHSTGSYATWQEAGVYHDVDGVIITGDEHLVGPRFAQAYGSLLEPAKIDPKWRSKKLPPGYFTTFPGTRESAFLENSNADPAVVQMDEQMKTTWPAGTALTVATIAEDYGLTNSIDVPVLVADGDHDYFCLGRCSAPLSAVRLSRLFYQSAPSFETYIQPRAGHSMNLQKNAGAFYLAAIDWANRKVGNG